MDLLYNLFVVGLQQIHNKSNKWSLSINTHIKTAEQRTIIQQYREWYTGRWWVGSYIWYSDEGTGRDAAPPSPSSLLYQM